MDCPYSQGLDHWFANEYSWFTKSIPDQQFFKASGILAWVPPPKIVEVESRVYVQVVHLDFGSQKTVAKDWEL